MKYWIFTAKIKCIGCDESRTKRQRVYHDFQGGNEIYFGWCLVCANKMINK
jgi:hypothetical protein